MRGFILAAAFGAALAGPAMADGLDVGRLLQEGGIVPGRRSDPRAQPERDRAIYEQGRRDEEARRQAGGRDRQVDGRRADDRDGRGEAYRDEDRRRGADDRFRGDNDRGRSRD